MSSEVVTKADGAMTSRKVWFALYTRPHKEYLVQETCCAARGSRFTCQRAPSPSSGGQPIPVPDEVVAHIRHRLAAMVAQEPQGPFKKGDVVRIVRGPFEGVDAVFDRRLSSQGRVRVFLQLMSRLVAADLDLGDLLPPRRRQATN